MSETTPFAEPNVYVKRGNAPVAGKKNRKESSIFQLGKDQIETPDWYSSGGSIKVGLTKF